MNEAGLAWCLASILRHSGNAGCDAVCSSIKKVIDILLRVRGIDAEVLRNMSVKIHSSHLACA